MYVSLIFGTGSKNNADNTNDTLTLTHIRMRIRTTLMCLLPRKLFTDYISTRGSLKETFWTVAHSMSLSGVYYLHIL
jgi:hypothetical protein